MNKVILLGFLGRDPESRFTQSGMAVCKFSVATNEYAKGEKKTTWHNVTCFGKTAELAQAHLAKGRQVSIEGRIDYQSWEKDGVKHTTTVIIADRVEFISGGTDRDNTPRAEAQAQQDHEPRRGAEDDVPF